MSRRGMGPSHRRCIARVLLGLAKKITTELLPLIKNLDSKQPTVNCTTCHRGEIKPTLDLPDAPPSRPVMDAAKH